MPLAMSKMYAGGLWDTNFDGTDLSTENQGTLLTANSTINTKAASWTTLISSTAFDCYGFWLLVQDTTLNANITSQLLDIRIGGSGGTIILPDFQIGGLERGREGNFPWFIPIFIPRGVAIEARTQANISSDTSYVTLWLESGQSNHNTCLYAGADAYGHDNSDSGGTAHTAGNGTPSTLASVGSTLSKNYGAALIQVMPNATSLGERRYHWELAISSVVKAGWLYHSAGNESSHGCYPPCPHQTSLVSGAQLQVRGECNSSVHDHDIAFHCFY